MTKTMRREDINDRHSMVMAERDCFTQKGSKQYKQLSEILKLIRTEYENGSKERHIMYMDGTNYGCTAENI